MRYQIIGRKFFDFLEQLDDLNKTSDTFFSAGLLVDLNVLNSVSTKNFEC